MSALHRQMKMWEKLKLSRQHEVWKDMGVFVVYLKKSMSAVISTQK